MDEKEFWRLVVLHGLPRFRFLRRPLRAEQLDLQFQNSHLHDEWRQLRSAIKGADKIWPFEIHLRSFLGMRRGIVIVRNGQAVGGIVTESS